MDAKNCEFEEEVIRESISEDWSPEISAHRGHCEICERSAQLTKQLTRLELSHDTVSPGIIWWKHELRLRRSRLDECFRPIQRFERIGLPLAVLLLLGVGIITFMTDSHGTSSPMSTIVLISAAGLLSGASVTLIFLLRESAR